MCVNRLSFNPPVLHLHRRVHTQKHTRRTLRDKSNVCHIPDLPVTIKGGLSPALTLILASPERVMEVTEPRGEKKTARAPSLFSMMKLKLAALKTNHRQNIIESNNYRNGEGEKKGLKF